MADKLIYMPNDDTQITPSVYLKWLRRINIQLNETTYQNSLLSPKLFKQKNFIIKLRGLVE